jgi:hypothetical protein
MERSVDYDAHKIFKSKEDVLMMSSLADRMEGEFSMQSEYSVNF